MLPSIAQPYHEAAQTVPGLLRGHSKPEDVMSVLESLRNSLAESMDGTTNLDSVLRSIAIQSLLHTGSRSFSHFLNAVEHYLPLLRNLAAGGNTSSGGIPSLEARMDILTASARFWKRNRQMVGIMFDKLMQYQIVDPTDVVSWAFGSGLGNGEGPCFCPPSPLWLRAPDERMCQTVGLHSVHILWGYILFDLILHIRLFCAVIDAWPVNIVEWLVSISPPQTKEIIQLLQLVRL